MENAIGIAIILMLVFMFLKVPVFISVMAGSVVYFLLTPSTSNLMIVQRIISGTESIPLLAIPFFVGMGVFMNYSGVSRRVMDFAGVIVGRMTGGLAQVNILVSTFMGGISGSNLADAAMNSKLLVPEMERQGYSKKFSSVITATSAMITPLIPPGIGMIMYGCVTNVSIGKMFISGLGVGLMLCIGLMILVAVISKKRGYKSIRTERSTLKEILVATKRAALPLILPIIIIGGVRIGAFTPTEAGAVGIMFALLLGFIYKEMTIKDVFEGLKETVISTATIMLIIGGASALSWIMTKERIPQLITEMMINTISNKYVFLLVVNLFLLFVGMLVEGNAITIVLAPLLAPVARAFGVDDIQFAMVFIFNLALGSLTPPMGTLMYVTCGITKCDIKDFIKESIPHYIVLGICLILLTFVPFLTTGLVSLFY